MNILSKEAILESNDGARELVEVPEWGGSVWIRSMTGTERDRFEDGLTDANGNVSIEGIRARLVCMTACDQDGKRMFADSDASMLGLKSAKALNRLARVAQRLSGLTLEAVEDAKKN